MTFKLIIRNLSKAVAGKTSFLWNLGYETPVLDKENNGSLITR
jgi:hypothetical protein